MPRLAKELRQFLNLGKLDRENFLTLTNPKVLKSAKVAPTVVLHLLPTAQLCPGAGICASLCLNKAGNPAYMTNKLACRRRRTVGFLSQRHLFMRVLTLFVLRFAKDNWNNEMLGFRPNGTSDVAWETIPVTLTADDSDYLSAHGIDVSAGEFASIFDVFKAANIGGMPVARKLRCYDYTKRADRDVALCNRLGYHITFSHGGKDDLFLKAYTWGRNYAAAFDVKRNAPLPDHIVIGDRRFPVIDGDVTDFRPGDPKGVTCIVGLRIKRTPGQTAEMRKQFCIA